MDFTTKLAALDLQLASNLTWEDHLGELFSTYEVDSFEDLSYFITEEEVMETIALAEVLLILI